MTVEKKHTFRRQTLSDEQLEALRLQVEGFDTIEHIDPEAREIIAEHWPHLLAGVPPKKP